MQTATAKKIQSCIDETWRSIHYLFVYAYDQGERARLTAKTAYKKKDKVKWQKFNAIARVYEMQATKLSSLSNDMQKHVSEDVLSKDIPF